eukprot:GDKH01021017.1.p1 GENE.GDKH01021017.1~~GDKH01021017.1.p1  ORF type:complete len:53 (+),score=3.22 GDKH01021017.1:34-192(+)
MATTTLAIEPITTASNPIFFLLRNLMWPCSNQGHSAFTTDHHQTGEHTQPVF